MLSSKRKCRSTWNIPSWHPLSLHLKLRSPWPISSRVQGWGLSSFRANVRGAQECTAASLLWASLRSLLIHLQDHGPAAVGNTKAHLGAMEQIHSIPLLWYSNHPALIFFFHRLSLRECFSPKSDSMNVRSQLIEKSKMRSQNSDSTNSPGHPGNTPTTQTGTSVYILT